MTLVTLDAFLTLGIPQQMLPVVAFEDTQIHI